MFRFSVLSGIRFILAPHLWLIPPSSVSHINWQDTQPSGDSGYFWRVTEGKLAQFCLWSLLSHSVLLHAVLLIFYSVKFTKRQTNCSIVKSPESTQLTLHQVMCLTSLALTAEIRIIRCWHVRTDIFLICSSESSEHNRSADICSAADWLSAELDCWGPLLPMWGVSASSQRGIVEVVA